VVLFFVITCVLWLSNREIEKSLERARNSEYALRLERDSLEERVAERTAEIKDLELKRVSDLYRFAEFGKLSSGIFHDLANPLTAVSISIENLRADGTGSVIKSKDVQEQIARAVTATKKMDSLIRTIGKQIKSHEQSILFSPAKEIEDVLTVLSHKARVAMVTITKEIDDQIVIFGNPLRLYQAVNNIVSNAIDACEENDSSSERHCHIELKKNGSSVSIIIWNTGPVISPDLLGSIFEPFFTTKPSDRGTGIGLSTSKNIIEKEFYGSIKIESIVEKTSFIITLPVRTEEKITE
jgi:two-component system C4-dicarboxylate transport sensor histidine kinase DctB